MNDISINSRKKESLERFLTHHDFVVEDLGNGVWRVVRGDEIPVFLSVSTHSIYFELDLGNVSAFADKDFYFKLLDLNTEVTPVSFGINSANPEDPHLVLTESLAKSSLDENEILSVFDSLELAVEKAESILTGYIN